MRLFIPLIFILALGCEHTEPECPECIECEGPTIECDDNNQCKVCFQVIV